MKKSVFFLISLLLIVFSIDAKAQTCTTPYTVPFLESFSSGSLPACWTNQNPSSTSANALWKFSGTPGYGATANGKPTGTYAWVDASTPNTGLHNVELISPQINTAGLTVPFVKFEWFKNNSSTNVPNDNNQLKVEVNNGSGWVQIFASTANDPAWRDVGIPLAAAYVNATIQLKFTVDKDLTGSGDFYDDLLLDEVQVIEAPTCFEASNLTSTVTGPTSATLSWDPPATVPANGYEYYISTTNTAPTAGTAGTAVAATTVNPPALVAGSTYYWWVRSVCSATDKSLWTSGGSFTLGQIGTGNDTTGNLPIYSCFGFNYSQQIYTAAEVGGVLGVNQYITEVSFYVDDNQGTTQSLFNTWTVYMGNTTQNNYATTTSWIPLANLSQVYTGTIANMANGTWVTIILNSPFLWDGTSNLVIAVDENIPGYDCTVQWGSYNAGPNRGILHYSDGTNADPANPPTASSRYAEIPKIKLNGIQPQPCSANPPTNLQTTNITSSTAIVSWAPALNANYVLQYREVGSGTWITVTPPPTGSSYQLTGLTELTSYEWQVAYDCSGTVGSFSAPTQFTTTAIAYCPAGPSSTYVDLYISNVTVTSNGAGVMSSSSSSSQYTDYTADPARLVTLVRGSANNSISVSKAWPNTNWSGGVGVWIDFDRDGVFESTEQVLTSPSNTTTPVTNLNFSVPNPPAAYTGPLNTRMRVILQEYGTPSTGCQTFTYGEVEDYAVKLIDLQPCGSAAPTNITVSNITATGATVSWVGYANATYVVQYREVGTTTWTTQTVTNSFINITGLTEQTQYEVQVATVCNGTTGTFSPSVNFTTPTLEWCTPPSPNSGDDWIAGVLVTPSPTSSPVQPAMNSGVTVGSGYIDYSTDATKLVNLVRGSVGNTLEVTKAWDGFNYNVSVRAWIDFNRNGTFEATEIVHDTPSNTTTPVNSTFDVPLTAYNGPFNTKMRIMLKEGTANTDPCQGYSYGEIEDYAVKLHEPIPCNNATPTNVVVSAVTFNSATVTWDQDLGGADYQIRYRPVGATTWTATVPVPSVFAPTNSYDLANLDPATQYEVEVIALCDNVPGTPAQTTFETLCDPAPPTNLMATNITSTSALITWDPVATATYTLWWRAVGDPTWTEVNGLTTTSYQLDNLIPYTTYEVQVSTFCSGAQNPFGTPRVFQTEPTCEMAPIGLIVTNITPTQAQVDWNDFPGATYVLRYRKVGSSNWTTINLTVNTYMLLNLEEQTQYELQVANVCNGTLATWTASYVFTTPTVTYCDMTSHSSTSEYISNVTVTPSGGDDISIDSGASPYTSFVNDPTALILLVQGSSNNQISVEKDWVGSSQNEAVTAWIDFNRDGVFANSERILVSGPSTTSPVSATFSVPADAYVSLVDNKYVVMRVAMQRDSAPVMCSGPANGEVEDYKVRIIKSPADNLIPIEDIMVYPNPTKDVLNITKVDNGAKFKIYNSIGQLVQQGTINAGQINVQRLINGVYVIDVDNKGKTAQIKFIKE